MDATQLPNRNMDVGRLLNENLSKKMGIGIMGMYLVSGCTDTKIATIIAGIALAGIFAQTLIDYRKLAHNDSSESAPD